MRKRGTTFLIVALLVCVQDVLGSENLLQVWANHLKQAGARPSPVALTCELEVRDGRYYLAFRMTNMSAEPVRFSNDALPWGNANAIELLPIRTNGQVIPIFYPIDDSRSSDEVALPVGASRSGRFDLLERVDLALQARESDIILAWSYRLPRQLGSATLTGVVAVPQGQYKR